VEDLQLYGVETVHRQTYKKGSRDFDESLPASSFEMTLAGGAKRGWVSKSDLLAAGYLDDARKKLKETQQMERNGKRTAQGIAAGNKKRTAQGIAAGNKKRAAQGIAARNKKRTAQGIAAGNKKRTAKGIAVENKKRTAAKNKK
jgi:hypothetical protein